MGLAPYGKPRYAEIILEHLVKLNDDGSFRLNQKFFNYCTGLRMTNRNFADLFDGPPREPESSISQREMDIAASIQTVTEQIMVNMARFAHKLTGSRNLVLAGGVALNCVANGKLLRSGIFEDIFIQPAAGDAGGALGCAYIAWYQHLGNDRKTDGKKDFMNGAYLGPSFSNDEIEEYLNDKNYSYKKLTNKELPEKIADLIERQNVIVWFQGRMEFGPRALGARSIIGDPRLPSMQKNLNLKIKYRESFRPFAPSVMREDLSDWFEMDCDSPYMLLVSDVAVNKRRSMTNDEKALFGIDKLNIKRSEIPAVTHVDYSARVQTVHKETNSKYYKLLSEFKKKTGCPVLVNTSFNVRGEPIVNTPEDAFNCFMGTELDVLTIGNCYLNKENQIKSLKKDYKTKYELD